MWTLCDHPSIQIDIIKVMSLTQVGLWLVSTQKRVFSGVSPPLFLFCVVDLTWLSLRVWDEAKLSPTESHTRTTTRPDSRERWRRGYNNLLRGIKWATNVFTFDLGLGWKMNLAGVDMVQIVFAFRFWCEPWRCWGEIISCRDHKLNGRFGWKYSLARYL